MSDLEQTQAIYLEDFGDETDEENEDGKKKIVSFLKVLKQDGFPEKLFPLYEGENIVGRKEDVCHVAIPLKALSREHACIEVRGENHLIYDKGSRNKTKRGKMYLIPEVRYELKNKDPLLFGDVKCVYIIGEPEDLDVDDSETGSESGFQTAPTDPSDPGEKRDKTSHVTTLVYDSEEEDEEAYDSDNSVDLLQPTQAYVQKQDGNKKSRINFDMETDEDESDRKSPDITVKETPAPRKTRGLASTAVVLPESGSETEEEDGEKESAGYKGMLQAPTQAFLAETEGETTEEDSPRKKILCAETQSFLEDKSKKTSSPQGVIVESENEEDKDEDVPVVEIDEDEENEEDRSHLFANPTLACDLPDEVEESEDDQEAEKSSNATEEDQEAETQVFTDQTVAVSDETLDVNVMKSKDRATAKNDKKTNTKDAATIEIDVNEGNNDETQEFSDVAGGDTLVVDKEECESTQVFDNKTTEAETVAMECEATQGFSDKAAEAETVAVECEATQAFNEAETVAIECESTQVFDNEAAKAETVSVECEATQVFDEKISEAETVVVECEATQVFDEKISEAETVAMECEATQVFDEKAAEAETVAVECEATQVFDKISVIAANVPVEYEEDQVLDNEQPINPKEDSDVTAETIPSECEPTVVCTEINIPVDDEPEQDKVVPKRGRRGKSSTKSEPKPKITEGTEETLVCTDINIPVDDEPEQDKVVSKRGRRGKSSTKSEPKSKITEGTEETLVCTDINVPVDDEPEQDKVVPKRGRRGKSSTKSESKPKITEGTEETLVCTDINVPVEDEPEQVVPKRGRRGKSSTKSKPQTEITEDTEEIQPKGRISKRKSVANEEKPVQNSQETKKGQAGKGRGGKHTDVVTEDADGGDGDISKKSKASLAEETKTKMDQFDGRIDDSTSDKVIEGKESGGQSTTVCDEDLEPTQAYCMDTDDVIDQEGSTTPPISELLGVEVKDGTPVEPVKFVDSEPDILPVLIPPASPHKSALASPGRRSPSPKKVHFQTRESEVVLNEVTGSKLKFEDKEEEEVSTGRSGGRSRRSLPNLSQPEVSARGKRGRLSVDPKVEAKAMTVPSTAKGKRGAMSQKANSEESSSTKKRGRGKNVIAISEEDTPPLEEENNENTDDQKSKEKCVIEEETSSEVSVAEQEVVKKAVGAKGRKGKRGSKAHADTDKEQNVADTEQQEDSSSQEHGTRKSKDMDKMEEPSNSEAKVVKTRRGKRKISETSSRDENEHSEIKNSKNEDQKSSKKSVVEEATQPYMEDNEADETVTETETSKKTRGRKSLAKSENVHTGRRGAKKSDKEKTEDDSEQTNNENSEKEGEMEASKNTGSKRTRKKDLLNDISEETPSNSQQAFGSSSQNVKARRGSPKKEKEHASEEVTSDTKSERKGRGKRKENSKDNAQESEACNVTESGKSKTSNKRTSAIRQDNEENSGESQDSVLSTESAVTRRGRGRSAQKQTTLSQDSEGSSGPTRKSRGRESSAAKKVEVESESQEIEDTKDKKTAAVKSSSKTRKNNAKDTSSIASDTELSSDSQESIQLKAAPKRGRGRHKTDEAKEEAPVKKTKMEPPSTPQHVKKSAKSSDSPSASLRRKSVDPSKPKVMFTGVTDEHGQKVVKDLGGHLVDSVHECSHLVTDKVRRTVKFLCCLARGIPIVNPQWLDSCKSSGMFVDHTPFLIKDEPAERQYKFALHSSLEKASDSSVLAGYKIHVTKSVKPDPANMKDIITCAGGEYLTTMPKKADDKMLVISCPDDKGICDSALKAGVTVVNAEFILTGILRQENAAENYILFQDKKRSRDSSVGGQPSKKRR
ncbi:mediator of DNA damage checkpoint protein 1-like [Crassostrea angulata]|uniref:mediator of DNA damage checkpoint protein 1-like n=1 Tax=Magallana angulata TaxID=2784310 RepID=UPI0022B15AA8|nr:mediator of DNA damage checkpoint protein 1-like [Crassostrea angulata]XP_052685231.1 mediator of DNA damage checkpoint protein 1-like [Crassostrea angulata]